MRTEVLQQELMKRMQHLQMGWVWMVARRHFYVVRLTSQSVGTVDQMMPPRMDW